MRTGSIHTKTATTTVTTIITTGRKNMLPLLWLVLLLLTSTHIAKIECMKTLNVIVGNTTTIANATNTTNTTRDDAQPGQCFIIEGNKRVQKDIGTAWTTAANPCTTYTCEIDAANNEAHIVTTEADCSEFYCDVDSELRPLAGSCCGECVRTRCRFNDTVYEVGQTWHNPADCTLQECAKLPTGMPIVNVYQKNCEPLPKNCPPEQIYTLNCCQYCHNVGRSRSNSTTRADTQEKVDEDIWTPEFYRQHKCVRNCKLGDAPMICHYHFVVEWYQTMSKACFDCPNNITDCERPHCIMADGISRSVTVVNRMMPGPAIEVCENDLIVVDVTNHLLGESTTMHWHGLHQRQTPYMDGVPHITQCPISPHASFRYTFKADNPGTHFWHSHTGMQRGDGVYGALIIRRPKAEDPHGALYDFDLSEHVIIVQDYVHVPGVSIFSDHHHSRGDNKPRTLLVNGRGRFYNLIWEQAKQQARTADVATTLSETTTVSNLDEEIDFLQPLGNDNLLRSKNSNEISRLARLATQSTKLQQLPSPAIETNQTASIDEVIVASRRKRATNNMNVTLSDMPIQVFKVRRGFRYRFRIINAEFLNCPIVVSIDNHPLTAINSDGYDFEAVDVGSIVTYAGERFDFVMNANQTVGNYWMRLKGLMDCSELFTSAFQVAIVRYEDAPIVEPNEVLSYEHKAEGIELNVMNSGPGQVDTLTVAELTALTYYDKIPGIDRDALKPVADYKFFVYYDFYAKNNPEFHHEDFYGFNDTAEQKNLLYTPQLNHISLKFPSIALLPSRDKLDDSLFCNDTSLAEQGIDCRTQFCKCHHVLQVPLNSIVELIIVDEGVTYDANHPFHLHGNAFRVVALERLGRNVTIEMVKQLDQYNLLKRNLVRPPVKDTVTVPDGGYTIVRFEAYNPGYWLFHCHIEFHAEIGMALVFKVGDNNEMPPVPHNFPSCGDYMPDWKDGDNSNGGESEGTNPTGAPITNNPDNDNAANKERSYIYMLLLNLLLLVVVTNRINGFS